MEDEFDEIVVGNECCINWFNNFYFGGDYGVFDLVVWLGGFKKFVGINFEGIDVWEVNFIKFFDDIYGCFIYVWVGKNGFYLECLVVGDIGEFML